MSCCWFPAPLRHLFRRRRLENLVVTIPSSISSDQEHAGLALQLIFPHDNISEVLEMLHMNSSITQVIIFGYFVAHLTTKQTRQLLRAVGSLPRLTSLQLVNFDQDTPLSVEDLSYALTVPSLQRNLRELSLAGGVYLIDTNELSPQEVSLEHQLSNLSSLRSLSFAHVTLASDEEDSLNYQSRLDPLLLRLPHLIPSLEQLCVRLRHRRRHLSDPNNQMNPASLLAPTTLKGLLLAEDTSKLTTLRLFQMELDNERLCTIAESLQCNNTLKELLLQGRRGDIQPQRLKSDACSSLTQMFCLNKSLARFHLRGIQIPEEHAMSLALALKNHNFTLTFLRLDYPSPGPDNNTSHQALVSAKKYRTIMTYYLKLNRSGVRRFIRDFYRQSAESKDPVSLEDWIQMFVGQDLESLYYLLSNGPSIFVQ